jgi:hypothetical protein
VDNPIAYLQAEQANHPTLRDLEIHQRADEILDCVRTFLDKSKVFTVPYSGEA